MSADILQSWLHDSQQSPPTTPTSPSLSSLLTTSNPTHFHLGTGTSIYTTLLPLLLSTTQELLLVTCFLARSPSLTHLSTTLLHLAAKSRRTGLRIRIRICFSSSGILQKLFHTRSLAGQTYAPHTWQRMFGLPSQTDLEGLDVEVKSIFVLPFSVMHPKFIVVDRRVVALPSCNVSWEDWLEGCVVLQGEVVHGFIRFWREFWAGRADAAAAADALLESHQATRTADWVPPPPPASTGSRLPLDTPLSLLRGSCVVQTVFLPSPHSANPRFRPFSSCAPPPPKTPLNTFLLAAFAAAKSRIYIQTPNLTSPPVLSALLAALARGVDVSVLTCERLMRVEQVVTAGTTTGRCVRRLVRRYGRLEVRGGGGGGNDAMLEEGRRGRGRGRLTIEYYVPLSSSSPPPLTCTPSSEAAAAFREPVQSHLKLTIVDDELVVLGSGNMDRASWFTSQELGVGFFSAELAAQVAGAVGEVMEGRRRGVFDSDVDG